MGTSVSPWFLVDKGADVNGVGTYGGTSCTPLWWAARAVGAHTRPLFQLNLTRF